LGPANLLASPVAELDDILPHLMDDRRDSAWATHGVSAKAHVWKTCTRSKVGPTRLFDSHCELLPLVVPS
jgi:hypothetical protein